MKKYLAFFLLLTTFSSLTIAKSGITLVENSFKIEAGKEEFLYFGFDEGDAMILKFEEVDSKELNIVEIMEMPSQVKFMEYKTIGFKKNLKIQHKGVYRFRFSNFSNSARVCKVKIQRVPGKKSSKSFNSNVYWRETNDTIFTAKEQEFYVLDTTFSNLTDQVAKVHSKSNSNSNKTTFNFTLPENTIAWSYYIGVEQEGQEAYNAALKEFNSKAIPVLLRVHDYGPLAALALGGLSYLSFIQTGEDIDYYIVKSGNENLFKKGLAFKYIKKGKVVNDFSQMTAPTTGAYHFCFENDNAVKSVSVAVKITAVMVTQRWEKRPIKTIKVNSNKEPYLKD